MKGAEKTTYNFSKIKKGTKLLCRAPQIWWHFRDATGCHLEESPLMGLSQPPIRPVELLTQPACLISRGGSRGQGAAVALCCQIQNKDGRKFAALGMGTESQSREMITVIVCAHVCSAGSNGRSNWRMHYTPSRSRSPSLTCEGSDQWRVATLCCRMHGSWLLHAAAVNCFWSRPFLQPSQAPG